MHPINILTDGNGRLSFKELRNMLRDLGAPYTRVAMEEAYAALKISQSNGAPQKERTDMTQEVLPVENAFRFGVSLRFERVFLAVFHAIQRYRHARIDPHTHSLTHSLTHSHTQEFCDWWKKNHLVYEVWCCHGIHASRAFDLTTPRVGNQVGSAVNRIERPKSKATVKASAAVGKYTLRLMNRFTTKVMRSTALTLIV